LWGVIETNAALGSAALVGIAAGGTALAINASAETLFK